MPAPGPAPATPTGVSSTQSPDTARVIASLEKGSEAQRQDLERILTVPGIVVDRSAIRAAAFKLLKTRYRAAKQPEEDDAEGLRVANTRAWLLYVLPLIADGDSECDALLHAAADCSIEFNKWCRYWCIAGQYRAGWPGVASVLPKVIERDDADLVVMLAHAIRAQAENEDSLEQLRNGLGEKANDGRRWGTLRALRIVPIEDAKMIQGLSQIVDRGANSDLTYDAIWALSKVSPESEYARLAGRTLGNFVDRWKTYPGRDGMRLKALKALASLKRLSESQILIDQFLDDNPAIVREAARALESMIGSRSAVDRVLGQAALTPDGKVDPYGVALRWMDARDDVVDQLATLRRASRKPC